MRNKCKERFVSKLQKYEQKKVNCWPLLQFAVDATTDASASANVQKFFILTKQKREKKIEQLPLTENDALFEILK